MPSIEISTGPPCSADTAMSSSVIADAIQSASRWETRPERAVTSPPPPRLTVRSPLSSRSNCAGPRLETMIKGSLSTLTLSPYPRSAGSRLGVELAEQLQPVAQQAGGEELPPGVFLAGPPQALAQLGVAENLHAPLRAGLGRVDQKAALAIVDLQ